MLQKLSSNQAQDEGPESKPHVGIQVQAKKKKKHMGEDSFGQFWIACSKINFECYPEMHSGKHTHKGGCLIGHYVSSFGLCTTRKLNTQQGFIKMHWREERVVVVVWAHVVCRNRLCIWFLQDFTPDSWFFYYACINKISRWTMQHTKVWLFCQNRSTKYTLIWSFFPGGTAVEKY